MAVEKVERIGFVGPDLFAYHITAEELNPGWSAWAPNDNDIFAMDFDLVLYQDDSFNIREYGKTHKIEKAKKLKNHLLLEGEKLDWAKSDLTVLWDGSKPFRVDFPNQGLKIFGAPINHPNYCGHVTENLFGSLIASSNKFLYMGTNYEHLNWTKKSDWGQGETYRNRLLKETIVGWFNGKIELDKYVEDFVRRYEII